jgi:hypothetical protein
MLLMIDKRHWHPVASISVHTLRPDPSFPSNESSNSNQHRLLQSK